METQIKKASTTLVEAIKIAVLPINDKLVRLITVGSDIR